MKGSYNLACYIRDTGLFELLDFYNHPYFLNIEKIPNDFKQSSEIIILNYTVYKINNYNIKELILCDKKNTKNNFILIDKFKII